MGSVEIPVGYADAGGGAPGLDQINVGPLPDVLMQIGGPLNIEVRVDGIAANVVQILF